MDMEILHHLDARGGDVFAEWFEGLSDLRARVSILQRATRLVAGNPGDHSFCRDGIWELRIDVGPGYRVYFARPGHDTVLLFHGGDKRRQRRDIERAVHLWRDYQVRVKRQRQ